MDKYLPWILMFSSVLVSSISQVLLKKSAKIKYKHWVQEYLNPHVIVGYGLLFLATIFTILAYKVGLSYKNGPVIESFGYVLIMFLSLACFQERITLRKALGNALVVVGIVIFYI